MILDWEEVPNMPTCRHTKYYEHKPGAEATIYIQGDGVGQMRVYVASSYTAAPIPCDCLQGTSTALMDDETQISITLPQGGGSLFYKLAFLAGPGLKPKPPIVTVTVSQQVSTNFGTNKYLDPFGDIKDTQPITPITTPPAPDEPRNNDGRSTCWWCNSPTRKAGGGQYDICTNKECGK